MAHEPGRIQHIAADPGIRRDELAVHRPAVTVAARPLQATGAIEYRRGRIVVLDRERLEEASCECYALVRGHYRRLLNWPAGA